MRRLSILLAFAVLIGLFHAVLFLSPWGETIELKFLDLWFNIRETKIPPEDIVITAIDEDSYGVLGIPMNQSWPRSAHTELLERLKALGVKRVVFDVLFMGPGQDPEIDQKLAEAFSSIPAVIGADYGEISEGQYTQKGLILPLEKFRQYCEKTAVVGLPEDHGYIRRFMSSPVELPTLVEAGVSHKEKPGPRDLINYYGPARTIPTFSYYQVLETEYPLPSKIFKDKIVFVGLSLRTELGPSQKDSYLTPFGRMFGVEIHATAAANLITKNWIHRNSIWIEVSALTLLALILTVILFSIKPQWGALLLLGILIIWGSISYLGFLNLIFIPGAVLTTITLPFSYLWSTLYYYIVTYRKQRQLQKAFQLYLSPEMAREVARNPEALKLGGEKVIATALFSDIESFTEISEPMPPEKVANMLNTYFTEVVNSIFDKKGTLIKFIGDAVFALWGAPIKTSLHAQLACESALAIQSEIERFNASGRFPALRTRIGIHTGPMVVGNLGSEKRFDFTAIGDSVNLASRVEGINKYFGTNTLVTNSVKEAIKGDFPSLKLGSIRPVGKKKSIILYTLFVQPISKESQDLWLHALAEFTNRNWNNAIKSFNEIISKEPRLKKAGELYLKEVKIHEQKEPDTEWHGEIVFLSK